MSKHNPQQAAKNQPTEAQTKTPTLMLPNLEIHGLKKKLNTNFSKVPDDGRTGWGV